MYEHPDRCRVTFGKKPEGSGGRNMLFYYSQFEDSELAIKPVDTIQRRILIAFGQGRIIENSIHEVIDGTLQRQYCLPNMNQLNGAVANYVDAQQFASVAMNVSFRIPLRSPII